MRSGSLGAGPRDVLTRFRFPWQEDAPQDEPSGGDVLDVARAASDEADSGAAGKRQREITQLLVDAIAGENETVLNTAIIQAKAASVEQSMIDEAEQTVPHRRERRKA